MRKMKKILSAALAALLLVGALAGCSGSSAGENGELVLSTPGRTCSPRRCWTPLPRRPASR